jgi:hypothetical protein
MVIMLLIIFVVDQSPTIIHHHKPSSTIINDHHPPSSSIINDHQPSLVYFKLIINNDNLNNNSNDLYYQSIIKNIILTYCYRYFYRRVFEPGKNPIANFINDKNIYSNR